MNRRDFFAASALATSATIAASTSTAKTFSVNKPKLRKAVKYSMINIKGTTLDKFNLAKKIGFEGVEVDSPSGINKHAAKQAAEKSGVVIHGVIDNIHWTYPLSSPDENVRAEGLAGLIGAIEDAAFFGCETVLLVPGVVNKDASYDQCFERSQVEVRKAIPIAEKRKVKICIETVWNEFITKPEQMVKYVDEFKSPVVGAYFDCSNMVKYGVTSGDWIRALGKRLYKFDFKGYSHTKKWCNIGDGDENWPDVLKALDEVGYTGWATSEVAGGGEKELKDIYERMTKVLEQ